MGDAKFESGDIVRLVGGNAAHLMTVRAASPWMVLCAWFGENGVQHAPYDPGDLELVQRPARQE